MVTISNINQETVTDTVSMVTMFMLPHNASRHLIVLSAQSAIVMLMALLNNSEGSSMASQCEDI